MLPPPHSLHVLILRRCWQMLDPPHSLHWLLSRLCSHCPGFPPRARLPPALLPPSSPSVAARLLLLPSPLCCPSFAFLPPEPPECPDPPPPHPAPLLSHRSLAVPLSARPLPLPLCTLPPPSPPAPALVAAPSPSASAPPSAAPAGSLPFPLPPLPASPRPTRPPRPTRSAATTSHPTAATASSRAPFFVSPATPAAPAVPSPSRSLRSMISLGAAAPPPAPLLHASIVSPPHVAHCPAYSVVPATQAQWTGLALHCEHSSAAVPRTDSEQKPHAYVPSYKLAML